MARERCYSFWERFSRFIGETYPGVFSPEWLFGGKKHGWSLRYKKSRSFCTMVPERERFSLVIVFGAEERAKAEAILPRLSEETGKASPRPQPATTENGFCWTLETTVPSTTQPLCWPSKKAEGSSGKTADAETLS